MFTCCPHCQTCFRITKAQLDVAQGKVRCGHCKQVFNGKQHLRESLETEAPKPSPPPTAVTKPAPAVPPSVPPETEGDKTKTTEEVDFDLFDLNSIPDSGAEEEDWFEQKEDTEQASDFVVVESDEWLDEEDEDDVTLNLDMDDYEYADEDEEDEEEEELLAETEKETPPDQDGSRYAYIEEQMPQEQQDIDQFIAEVNAQLEEAIEEPGSTDPFKAEIDKEADVRLHPEPVEKEPAKEEPASPSASKTDDAFKQAFLANLDSGLELEPTSPPSEPPSPTEAAFPPPAKQTSPTDIPPEPVFPPATKPKSTETKPDMGAVDEILSTAKQPKAPVRPTAKDEIPFHLRDSLLVEEQKRHPIKLILGVLGILLFSVVLLGQLAFFRSSQLVDKLPALQPMVEKFCTTIPCIYSGPRDISQIRLVNRDIRVHPKVDNALLISATFINRAAFKQPYPDITITLSDLSGALVAQRRFKPAEYLGQLNSPFLLMPSGKPVQIALEVVDPGKDAVNFEFTFQ